MKGVFLDTDSIAPADLNTLALQSSLDSWTFYPSTLAGQQLERIKDADVVITNKIQINAELMQAATKLKLILVAATGANNIDLTAAKKYGIAVANVRGYGPATVAQHTFALILALSTNLINYAENVRQGLWSKNHFFCLLHHPITELADKNLLIVGYGEIGKAVAQAAKGFGMQVMIARSLRESAPIDQTRKPLAELLPLADVVTLHCPLTPETNNLIDAEAIASMKPSAFLVNVSRGGLVNEPALVTALKSNQIAGAGVDVLTVEPPVNGNPLIDEPLPNLIVTPHCAWGSREARQRLVDEMVLNLQAFLNDQPRNRLV